MMTIRSNERTPDERRSAYLAKLPLLQRSAWKQIIGGRVLAACGLLLTVPFLAFPISVSKEAWIAFAVIALVNYLVWTDLGLLLSGLRDQVEYSELATRLEAGTLEEESDILLTYVPRWLRYQTDGTDFNTLRRVSANLSWYVCPPRPIFDQRFTLLLLFTVGSALVLFVGGVVVSIADPRSLVLLISIVVLAVLIAAPIALLHRGLSSLILAEYLSRSWNSANGVNYSTRAEKPQDTLRHANTHMLLNQFEQDITTVQFSRSSISVPLGFLLVLTGMTVYTHGIQGILSPVGALVLLGILSNGIVFYMNRRWLRKTLERIRDRLDNSEIAVLVAGGDLGDRDLMEHVPWLFRFQASRPIAPKGYGDSFRRALWRLAFNLDWYLSPPQRLVRAAWVTGPVSEIVGVGLLIATFFLISGLLEQGLPLAGTLFLLSLLVSVPVHRLQMAQKIWSTELIRYLRERLSA